jgi:hypothetical protein
MTKSSRPTHQIELRVTKLSALFNSMDPTPFHHRDLDTDAEEFLESWALEFPQNSRFRIVIHIDEMPTEDPEPIVGEAIHNYFQYKTVLIRRSLKLLLLEGRTSLVIGLCFLALCLLLADVLSVFAENAFWRVLRESLIIGGWVAMWRPMQIFLYEWWPLVRRGRILRSLGHASVNVVPGKASLVTTGHATATSASV